MDKKSPALGRTGIVVLAVGAFILAALYLCLRKDTASAESMFSTAAWALVTLAIGKAGQSTLEAISTGTGLKGIARTVMTDAKPGAPDTVKVTESVEQTVTRAP